MVEIVDRLKRRVAEQRCEAVQRALPALISGQLVERAGVDEAQQNAGPRRARADVERDEHRTLVRKRLTRLSVRAPERCGIGGVGLAESALRPMRDELVVLGGQRGRELDEAAMSSGGTATTTNRASARPFSLVTSTPSSRWSMRRTGGLQHDPVAEFSRRPRRRSAACRPRNGPAGHRFPRRASDPDRRPPGRSGRRAASTRRRVRIPRSPGP